MSEAEPCPTVLPPTHTHTRLHSFPPSGTSEKSKWVMWDKGEVIFRLSNESSTYQNFLVEQIWKPHFSNIWQLSSIFWKGIKESCFCLSFAVDHPGLWGRKELPSPTALRKKGKERFIRHLHCLLLSLVHLILFYILWTTAAFQGVSQKSFPVLFRSAGNVEDSGLWTFHIEAWALSLSSGPYWALLYWHTISVAADQEIISARALREKKHPATYLFPMTCSNLFKKSPIVSGTFIALVFIGTSPETCSRWLRKYKLFVVVFWLLLIQNLLRNIFYMI